MSPAISSASLSALVNPHLPSPGSTSPLRSIYESSRQVHSRPRPPPRSFAAVASETFFFEDDEDQLEAAAELAQEESSQWEDAVFKSSTSESDSFVIDDAALDGSDDDGTQLAPRTAIAGSQSTSIPAYSRTIRERERSLSDSVAARPSVYSPVQSRSLGQSYPTAAQGWTRRGSHRHRQPSDSPGPASLDERRRARAARPGGRTARRELSTDDDITDAVDLENTFFELVDAASMLMSMSPRHASGSVLSGGSVTTTRLGAASPRHSGQVSPRPVLTQSRSVWTPEPTASPESVPSSDPFLASSVPTLDLSSGTDEGRSPTEKAKGSGRAEGAGGEPDKGCARSGGGGWFGWLSELRLWHLVSIAGILVGVGLNAGAIVHASKHLMNRLSVNTAQ